MWQHKPDLLYVVSAPLGLAASAYLLSRRWQIPYAFYVSDMQPDAAAELGMLPVPVMKFLYGVESFAYRNAALIPTLTEGMRQRIISKGVAPEKVVVFSHCANQPLFDVPTSAGGQSFRREHKLEGQFIVMHSGNMGVKQGLGVVLDAAERSHDIPDVSFVLVGDGADRPSLEARAKAKGLTNVHFLPLQPRDVFLDMLAASDISLITQQRAVADIVFPSKTETLLAAGRAVVASLNAGSEVARVLAESGGEVVAAEDPDALLQAILQLKADPDRRRNIGEKGRAYAREHWGGSTMLAGMEARLIEVATVNPRSQSDSPEASAESLRNDRA